MCSLGQRGWPPHFGWLKLIIYKKKRIFFTNIHFLKDLLRQAFTRLHRQKGCAEQMTMLVAKRPTRAMTHVTIRDQTTYIFFSSFEKLAIYSFRLVLLGFTVQAARFAYRLWQLVNTADSSLGQGMQRVGCQNVGTAHKDYSYSFGYRVHAPERSMCTTLYFSNYYHVASLAKRSQQYSHAT